MIHIKKKQETPEKQFEPLAVDTKSAAKMLSISERTLFKLTKEGKIACRKIGWKSLYPVSSLKAFLETPNE
jgi:excisionase family DNA binding protein